MNALRAALQQGRFPSYHAVIYENQPDEQNDGFTDAFLLSLASKVDGLRGTAFDKAVKRQRYSAFVTKSEKAFLMSGAQGTPYVKTNGKAVSSGDPVKLHNPVLFAKLLKDYGVS